MPGDGQWKNVKSVFPIHNKVRNKALLSKFSRQAMLNRTDLDEIRAVYGEKAGALYPRDVLRLPSLDRLLFLLSAELYDRPPLPLAHRCPSLFLLTSRLIVVRHLYRDLVCCLPRILEDGRDLFESSLECSRYR